MRQTRTTSLFSHEAVRATRRTKPAVSRCRTRRRNHCRARRPSILAAVVGRSTEPPVQAATQVGYSHPPCQHRRLPATRPRPPVLTTMRLASGMRLLVSSRYRATVLSLAVLPNANYFDAAASEDFTRYTLTVARGAPSPVGQRNKVPLPQPSRAAGSESGKFAVSWQLSPAIADNRRQQRRSPRGYKTT